MVTKLKTIAAAVGLIVTTLSGQLVDDVLDFNEIGVLVTYLLTGAASVWAVWRVPYKTYGDAQSDSKW